MGIERIHVFILCIILSLYVKYGARTAVAIQQTLHFTKQVQLHPPQIKKIYNLDDMCFGTTLKRNLTRMCV